ncbi:MAG: rhodanese-like domain-containing protein [Rhodospirillales bacterium]|nr:rhodanese-like domain-containing protein [Rhodospirillales bacterium]
MSEVGYAGDLSPIESFDLLKRNQAAVLIDVRTDAEFAYVGAPDCSTLKNAMHKISWVLFPAMTRNPHFEDAVREAVPDKETPILFLCRSGVRSVAAAKALTALGYNNCFNVAEGFEGDKNADNHRGTVNGWKVRGLPWVQG